MVRARPNPGVRNLRSQQFTSSSSQALGILAGILPELSFPNSSDICFTFFFFFGRPLNETLKYVFTYTISDPFLSDEFETLPAFIKSYDRG